MAQNHAWTSKPKRGSVIGCWNAFFSSHYVRNDLHYWCILLPVNQKMSNLVVQHLLSHQFQPPLYQPQWFIEFICQIRLNSIFPFWNYFYSFLLVSLNLFRRLLCICMHIIEQTNPSATSSKVCEFWGRICFVKKTCVLCWRWVCAHLWRHAFYIIPRSVGDDVLGHF